MSHYDTTVRALIDLLRGGEPVMSAWDKAGKPAVAMAIKEVR